MPEKYVDPKKYVDSGFLKESKQEDSPVGQNVEKARIRKNCRKTNTIKKKTRQEGNLQMHQKGHPFGRHIWNAFLDRILDHSALRLVP